MRLTKLAVIFIIVANNATASGLSDPEVLSPVLGFENPCDQKYTASDVDYIRAHNHFTNAVGQSDDIAEASAKNMVNSHLIARAQTCDADARAVTNNWGYPIPDGLGGIVINLPR